jgi:hypothetical protein
VPTVAVYRPEPQRLPIHYASGAASALVLVIAKGQGAADRAGQASSDLAIAAVGQWNKAIALAAETGMSVEIATMGAAFDAAPIVVELQAHFAKQMEAMRKDARKRLETDTADAYIAGYHAGLRTDH